MAPSLHRPSPKDTRAPRTLSVTVIGASGHPICNSQCYPTTPTCDRHGAQGHPPVTGTPHLHQSWCLLHPALSELPPSPLPRAQAPRPCALCSHLTSVPTSQSPPQAFLLQSPSVPPGHTQVYVAHCFLPAPQAGGSLLPHPVGIQPPSLPSPRFLWSCLPHLPPPHPFLLDPADSLSLCSCQALSPPPPCRRVLGPCSESMTAHLWASLVTISSLDGVLHEGKDISAVLPLSSSLADMGSVMHKQRPREGP